MKPVIGITPSINTNKNLYTLHVANVEAIIKAGGIPLIIPYTENKQIIEVQMRKCAGLYVTGGNDIDPHYFHEDPLPGLGQVQPERDAFEIKLVQTMVALNKPVLGVCRGSQIINVALGGTMYQDLLSQRNSFLVQHTQYREMQYPSHVVHIEKNSLLYDIVQTTKIRVNSNHHQANRKLGANLIASAMSNDQVIEAIECQKGRFILGVQWHPERLVTQNDVPSRAIYNRFIKEASSVRK